MSRFLKIMIVLLTIAAVATPVMAEDRLGLGGQMRVRGWHIDDGSDNTTTYMDQRLRIGGKLAIADGVSVTFRFDETEKTWGDGGSEFGAGRMPQDGMQWDRAHFDVDFGTFALRGGQQYVEFGKGLSISAQEAGLKASIKGAVPVTLFWMLDDQNGGTDTADSYLFGGNVGHKTDMYAANVYFGGQTKAISVDEEAYLIGVDATFNLEAVKLIAALDYFTGDAADGVDAMGTQFMLDGSVAATETVTVGAQLFFALSADEDEDQYVLLGNDFGGWDPLFDVGTGLSNEKIGAGRPYDLFGANAGIMALRGYANIKATDTISFGASLLYAEPEEEDNVAAQVAAHAQNPDTADATFGESDSLYALALGMTYDVMANTSFHAQVEYLDPSDSDEVLQAGVAMFVNF